MHTLSTSSLAEDPQTSKVEGISPEVRRAFPQVVDIASSARELHMTEAELLDDAGSAFIRVTRSDVREAFHSHLIRIYPVRTNNQEGGVPGEDVLLLDTTTGEKKLMAINTNKKSIREWLMVQMRSVIVG